MNIIPRNDKLVVKRLEKETKVGSIMLPDADVGPSNKAEVIAVGPKCDPELKAGVIIVFDERANEEFGGYLLLNNRDVYGILS